MHDHSIWTFEYCAGKLPSDFMGGAPIRSNQGLSDITMVYSVIRTAPSAEKQLTILVDTGGIPIDWDTGQLLLTAIAGALAAHFSFWKPSTIGAKLGQGQNVQDDPRR